jgi:polar amino acid transport system substrate-binding protein
MSDESFARRMRDLERPEAPDPAFVDRLYTELAGELGFRTIGAAAAGPVRLIRRRRGRSWPLLAVAALLLTLGIGAFVTGGGLRGPTDDLLARLHARGSMIVAVSRDHPQVVVPGVAASGFDVAVADALSGRLGLGFEPVAYPPGSIGSLFDRAHLAMPAADVRDWQDAGWSLLEPVYHWPHYLLVGADAAFADPSALSGRRIGVTDERLVPSLPAGAVPVTVADDSDCLGRLESGDLDACLTATLGGPDIVARPTIRVLGAPAVLEPRGPMVRASGDSDSFATAVREAITGLRDDGVLADLSRRFLGEDLTAPPKDS